MRVAKIQSAIISRAYGLLDTRKTPHGKIAMAMQARKNETSSEEEQADDNFQDIKNCVELLESYCLAKQITQVKWLHGKPIHPIFQALNLLATGKGITLLTGHTAKGLEWLITFHYVGKMRKPETAAEEHQSNCLSHVIGSRAILEHYTLE